MSTPQNADQAHIMIDRITAIRRNPNPTSDDLADLQKLYDELSGERPSFDDITEGLIASTLRPMYAPVHDLTVQGIDP